MHGGVSKELLDYMCKDRREELIASTKDKLSSVSRSIKVKALTMLPVPLRHHERPYGLPPNWDDGRDQIWWHILKFVDEPEDIINASETCALFRDLLPDKYKATRLAEALEVCMTKRDWMLPSKTLLDLRRVSRAAKNYIDQYVMRGSLNQYDGCLEYLIPGIELELRASQLGQSRLGWILPSLEAKNVATGTFPLRKVVIREGRGLDLLALRDAVRRLFELVGNSIHSLTYISRQGSCDTYNFLRGWVSLLPNLEEVDVGIRIRELDIINPYEPFPRLPQLKRFQELFDTNAFGGFALSHLCEIVRANPTLQLVRLSSFPENRLNSLMTAGILDQHQLIQFSHNSNSSLVPFFGRQVNWPLKKLSIQHLRSGPIPAETFFNFINQFGTTLKELTAYVLLGNVCPCETGKLVMMNLPNLKTLRWRLETDSQCLRFMIPLKRLEYLVIYLPNQNQLQAEGMQTYLETFHIPSCTLPSEGLKPGRTITDKNGQ